MPLFFLAGSILIGIAAHIEYLVAPRGTRRKAVFRFIRAICGLTAVLSFILILFLLPFTESVCPWDSWADTVCAPGFAEEKFQQIRYGMTRKEVESILGPPLRGGPGLYFYTSDGGSWLWDFAWQGRAVRFVDERVVGVESRTYYD